MAFAVLRYKIACTSTRYKIAITSCTWGEFTLCPWLAIAVEVFLDLSKENSVVPACLNWVRDPMFHSGNNNSGLAANVSKHARGAKRGNTSGILRN